MTSKPEVIGPGSQFLVCRQPKNVAIVKLQRHRGLIRRDPVYHFYPTVL